MERKKRGGQKLCKRQPQKQSASQFNESLVTFVTGGHLIDGHVIHHLSFGIWFKVPSSLTMVLVPSLKKKHDHKTRSSIFFFDKIHKTHNTVEHSRTTHFLKIILFPSKNQFHN